MARATGCAGVAQWLLFGAFATFAFATPNIALPFNAQVPTVARVDEPYVFQFSDSTFAPDTTNFTYSLSGQQAWLSVDSASRTLSGTPDESSVGASTFTLTAADDTGAAHMSCTMVVSSEPAPKVEGDISEQLAATANLSSSDPPIVTILPSTPFSFEFQRGSFIDIVQRKLYYYATLTDHTPLPSWLAFDATSMTFTGTAPLLSAFPQSWNISLIASDVAGFGGATASFTVAIGTQQLVFVPSEQTVNVTGGTQVDVTALQKQLYQNGVSIAPSALLKAEASPLPSWLSFDPTTLALSGEAPANFSVEVISVTVTDKLGNNAATLVNLVSSNASLFAEPIGVLTAYTGRAFTYHIPDDLFSQPDVQLTVAVPSTATWLQYDSSSRTLQGTAPSQPSELSVTATLTARSSELPSPQSLTFTIDIKDAALASDSPSATPTSASSTSSPTVTPLLASARTNSRPHLSGGVIAAIVILSILAVILLLALFLIFLRRRRRDGYERHSATPVKKSIISRPIPAADPDAIMVTTELQRDTEKAGNEGSQLQPATTEEPPPQIMLNLPSGATSNRRSRWLQRFSRTSQVSSLGDGEYAIRADMNIPEWGVESAALHTPHDSFSVPAELARVSRQLSNPSPTKRAMRRLRERQQSRQSVGLGIDTGPGLAVPRHNSRHSKSHRQDSTDPSIAMDRNSQASISTRGTSLLSTRPSDFPRPPTRLTLTHSVPISDADNHKSIRLVGRSDSITDNRSIAEKRQSFIRNRASTSLQSPLFAHGSRAPSGSRHEASGSVGLTSAAGSMRRARRGRSQLKSYSESSSLEPMRESKRLSARVRSAFAPNYPRAITQSSLGADDEGTTQGRDSSSGFYTTSSSVSTDDLTAQMALPRHQRSWVLPGEASPTPPPAPPTSRQPSSAHQRSTALIDQDRRKERTSSPLSTAVAVPIGDRNSLTASGKASIARKSRLSEPISLVSNDSVNRAKLERPRLVHTNSKRPVSVEHVKRLSSLKAETGTETDTQAGSEAWEDIEQGTELEGSGLMPKAVSTGRADTQKSNMSGPAFL